MGPGMEGCVRGYAEKAVGSKYENKLGKAEDLRPEIKTSSLIKPQHKNLTTLHLIVLVDWILLLWCFSLRTRRGLNMASPLSDSVSTSFSVILPTITLASMG